MGRTTTTRCEAVLCIAQRNFFRDPHLIANTMQRVLLASGNSRYISKLQQLGFSDEYGSLNILDVVATLCNADAAAADGTTLADGAAGGTSGTAGTTIVVDAHLQRKILGYMQCKQHQLQQLIRAGRGGRGARGRGRGSGRLGRGDIVVVQVRW